MSELNNSGIISVLLDRVSELSERIAPTNSAINSEVRNVFSRNEATSSSSTSTATRQSQQHGPSSSSQQASLMEDRLPVR